MSRKATRHGHLIHELAVLDKPEPSDLPVAILARRRAWAVAWLHAQNLQHAYMQALAAHYNRDGSADEHTRAVAWLESQRATLTRLIAEREGYDPPMPTDIHRRELAAVEADLERLTNRQLQVLALSLEPPDNLDE